MTRIKGKKISQNLKIGTPKMVFSLSTQGEEVFHQKDLIKLEPYGLSMTADANHPFLLFKDKAARYTLPVRLNPLEAGVALTQSNKSIAPVTPHKFAQVLMQSLDVKIQQCVFVQISGGQQYVRLYLKGHPKMNSLKLRADEVMSLVLHLNVPLYATAHYIEKSKVLNTELEERMQNSSVDLRSLQKTQNYVI